MTDDGSPQDQHESLRGDRLPSKKPYHLPPGSVSLFHGFEEFYGIETRAQKLARPIRAATIHWLVNSISNVARRSETEVREAIIAAIPHNQENVLDGGEEFIFIVIEAALCLGVEPSRVRLAPDRLDS